jgi:hypothetical protein
MKKWKKILLRQRSTPISLLQKCPHEANQTTTNRSAKQSCQQYKQAVPTNTRVQSQHYITLFVNPVFGEHVICVTKYTVSCTVKGLSFHTNFIYVFVTIWLLKRLELFYLCSKKHEYISP